jgi:hypothetical protein
LVRPNAMNDAYATPSRSNAMTGSPLPYMIRLGVMTWRMCRLYGQVLPPSNDV